MTDTEQGANGRVFISYSRKDKPFVQKLNEALDQAGVHAWVDWEGIELASDWMETIKEAIQGSDAFLFVISPDSLKSSICAQELEFGISLNKTQPESFGAAKNPGVLRAAACFRGDAPFFLHNSDAVLRGLERFSGRLELIRAALASGDAAARRAEAEPVRRRANVSEKGGGHGGVLCSIGGREAVV